MTCPGCSILTHNNQLHLVLQLLKWEMPGAMKTKFSKNKALETNIQIVWIELLQNFIYFNLPSTLICTLICAAWVYTQFTQLNLFPLGASHQKLAIRWPYEHFSKIPVQFTSMRDIQAFHFGNESTEYA